MLVGKTLILKSFLASILFSVVVYQRQIQKGNLATITVDGSSSADSSSARFTKEELRDCFTLKEDCDCDTKRKVGKRWPEYGKSGIVLSLLRNSRRSFQLSLTMILFQAAPKISEPKIVTTCHFFLWQLITRILFDSSTK